MNTLFEDSQEDRGAVFSEDRKHRYALWRKWDKTKPMCAFIGLNPSTANEATDDPTIRRVKAMAKSWGYGGVYMLNLFSYVSTDPKALLTCEDPIADNDKHLELFGNMSKQIVFAWGNFKVNGRDEVVKKMFPTSMALQINKNGSPKHPLYVRADKELVNYQ